MRSHETPPFIFGLGNPCDKRSCRMMYQFLIPKVGGTNLSQVVKPQVGAMIPRDSTNHQSAMIWRLAEGLELNIQGLELNIQGRGEGNHRC